MNRTVEVLTQLAIPTADGNLIDKPSRDILVREGYVARRSGWNFLTGDGIDLCILLGILKV